MTVPEAAHGGRAAVLATLQRAGAPLTVAAVAERVGLHPNTARFHLQRLTEAGDARRGIEIRTSRGRPRTLYRAVAASAGRRSYRLLAEVLAGCLAGNLAEPALAASAAGRRWGRSLVERAPGAPRPRVADATADLLGVLDEVGFAPEAVTAGRSRRILLHQCPFLEAAQQNTEVVCAVHLGLMQGALEALRAPVVAERLEPFVSPGLCVTHLASGRGRQPVAAH